MSGPRDTLDRLRRLLQVRSLGVDVECLALHPIDLERARRIGAHDGVDLVVDEHGRAELDGVELRPDTMVREGHPFAIVALQSGALTTARTGRRRHSWQTIDGQLVCAGCDTRKRRVDHPYGRGYATEYETADGRARTGSAPPCQPLPQLIEPFSNATHSRSPLGDHPMPSHVCSQCARTDATAPEPGAPTVCHRVTCRERARSGHSPTWVVWMSGRMMELLADQALRAIEVDDELDLAGRVAGARIKRHGRGHRAAIRVDDGDQVRGLARWLKHAGAPRREVASLQRAAGELDDILLERALEQE